MSSAHEEPNSFFNDLLNDIEKNRLPLPTQPKIALAIQEINLNPHITASKLSEVIGKDPGLAARVIRIANSPLARGVVIINNLEVAISRLGVQFVASMAMGLAMEQLFFAKHEIIADKLQQAWVHSAKVAAMSYVLADMLKIAPAHEAALAGLLHEIGTLPILVFAEKNPQLLEDSAALDALIQHYYAQLGEAILTSWQFPRDIAALPLKMTDLYRQLEQPDLADIVLVAKITMLKGSQHPLAYIDKTEIPAFNRLKLNAEEDLLENEKIAPALDSALKLFLT